MKSQGFAYPTVLLTLVLMTLLTLHMLETRGSVARVEQEWHHLDQAELNCANALNHFLTTQKGYQPNSVRQSFDFAPSNGFSWRALPFGMFWLMEVEGYAGNQKLTTRFLVGGATADSSGPVLQIEAPVVQIRVDKDSFVNGKVLWSEQHNDEFSIPGALVDNSIFGKVPALESDGLQDHLQQPFTETWRNQLRSFLPSLAWREVWGRIDLDDLALSADLLVLSGGDLILNGAYTGETPLLILSDSTVSAPEGLALERTWIHTKTQFTARQKLTGFKVHITAPSVDIAGEITLQASTLTAVTAGSQTGPSTLILRGSGTFQGALTAVAGGSSDAVIDKDEAITTAGLIHCEGTLITSGSHQGLIRTRHWTYRDGTATYPNRIAKLELSPGDGSLAVWGIEGNRGEVLHTWEVQ